MALADRTLDLVNIPSESRSEAALYDYVRASVPLEAIYDDGESVVFAKRSGNPLVLLAGHTDTVPAQGNLPGRIEDGAVVGLGASDMKGGLAVMIELARWACDADTAYDVAFLFFPREEVGPAENPLPGLFERTGIVDEAQLVICLEPTDNTLQLGCLGNLNARIVFEGRAAHSARPWLGTNAIAVALDGLGPVLSSVPRDVDIDGLVFREVMSVTQLSAGIATNVIPARAEANVNFRYAPDRSPASADAYLRSLVPEGASYEHAGDSPPARVVTDSPLVQRLRAAGDLALEPKQAWTNVADFTSRGIDAVNFGPGATRYAHRRDEQVEIVALETAFTALWRFVTGSV